MQRHRLEGTSLAAAAVVALLLRTTVASAQSPPSPPPTTDGPPAAGWHVSAGYGSVAFRDVARSHPPVDASPVSWRGEGMSLLFQYIRTHATRSHRYELSTALAGNFAYDSGIETTSRPHDDHYRRLEGRYEYRRYFFTNVGLRGLDVGGGVQGLGSRASLSRHVPENIEIGETAGALAGTGVLAARFRRWSRFGMEFGWINGINLTRLTSHHSEYAGTRSQWGGGWLTDYVVGADVPVTPRASLTVTYFHRNDGLLSSHRGVTSARSSLSLGVMYAR